ncbi:T9SS type B sorting domain-containing protein [Flavobacterium sp. N1719]|uniref:T9SS type B sorting domain-containing protein n=1 Tax=Flavobacterium sp. N1719 TaxID=2885633 RepID=UPI002223E678|nr:T9SS type B sorting domain-containing protein [Flavobacterium sp. N1719]
MRIFTLKLLFIVLFVNVLQAQNLLNNGDFESGGVGVGFNINGTGYNYVATASGTTAAGDYSFTTNPQPFNTTNFITTGDHTSGSGKMMIIDGSNDGGNPSFWKAGNSGGGVCGLTVGATYTFRYWVRSISTTVTNPATQADIRVVFNNATVVTSPASTLAPVTTAGWEQRVYTFTPTNACVNIELRNFNTSFVGNDFAIDDLAVIPPPQPLTVRYSVVTPYCATPATGSISVYGNGGTAPYTNYTIAGPVNLNNTTGVFTNLPVGNYTVSVTDTAGNTVSQNNVQLTGAPNPLTVSPNSTICAGGNTTLSVAGGTSYTWTASPADPSLTTPTSATPTVSPTTTTTYTVSSVANFNKNLVYNGDFSLGNIGFATDYVYVTPINTSGAQQLYGVVNNPNAWYTSFVNCPDHTNGSGNMMVVDASVSNSGNDVVWSQTIPVTNNTNYTFSYWVQTLSPNNYATLQVKINGTALGTAQAPTTTVCGNWTQVTYNWNSGASTTAQIAINDTNTAASGNDFALDDISFTTAITCNATSSVTVTVNTLSISVPSNQTYCDGATVPVQTFTSSLPGTTFTWTNSNSSITIGSSGLGNINSFLATNNTTVPQTTTITVTGAFNGCANDVKSYTITVNPPPAVLVNNIVKCTGDTSPGVITATPSFPGTYNYAWTVPVGVPAPGNVASFPTTIAGNYSVTITNTTTGCTATSLVPGVFSFDLDCCVQDAMTVSAEDYTLCENTNCTVLSSSFIDIKNTTNYTVASIPYAPEQALGNFPTALCAIDDAYTSVVNIPFQFSFYGQCYNQFQLSTNTYLTFIANNAACTGGTSPWAFTQSIPALANAIAEFRASIYFPMQDTNPAVPSTPAVSINYIVDGVAPCRKLIVNVKNMPLFSCGTGQGLQESQLVLHESTNIIDIHVKRRSVCAGWNSGSGVIGIQNELGNLGLAAPGRNTGTWTTTNESWRFTPSGPSLTSIEWLNGTTVIGTTPSISVCPTTTTTYTANVKYNLCGGVRTVTRPITIEVSSDDTSNAPSLTNCIPNNTFDLTQNEAPVLGPLLGTGEYEVYYYLNQSDAENLASNNIANPSSYLLTSGNSQIIYMSLYNVNTGCIRIKPFSVSMIDCSTCPTITSPSPAQTLCLGADMDPLSVSTTFAGTNAISYVYFTTPQVGSNMYTGGTLLGNATPNASSIATYNPGVLGTVGSLPNATGTYYIYAIANPTPSLLTCRPYQEIIVTITSLNGLSLTSAPATTNQTLCLGTAITPITYTYDPTATATVTGLPAGVTAAISAGNISITGTPTATTATPLTYTVSVTGSACGSPTATGTIMVQPIATLVLTSAAATSNQTICDNVAITNIEYTFGGSATGANISGLPAGVTAAVSGNTLVISGTPTTSTGSPFNYTVTTTGGSCGTPSLTGTITVNPTTTLVLTSATGTDSQTVCVNSPITPLIYTYGGSATGANVTGLPAGVTSTISGNTITISGSPTTTVGSPSTITITTTGGSCGTPSMSANLTVQPQVTLTLTSVAATTNQSVCLNSPITNIIYTLGNGATGATVTGLPAGVTASVTGTTVTISGSPTTAVGSPFSYTVTTTGGCGTQTLTGSITISQNVSLALASGAGTTSQTVCINSPITNIDYTFGNGATGATVTGLPAGVTATVTGNTVTISGSPTTNVGSPFNYTVTSTGGCGTQSLTGTITVNVGATLVLSSTAFLANQTVCVNSPITNIVYTFGGSATGATVTGLPAGVTFSVSGNSVIISGSPSTLVASPYTFTVSTTGGTCGAPSLTGTITVEPIATLVLTSNASTTNQTVCENSAITNIVYTFGGTATGATVTGLPAGVTATVTGNTVTISGAPTSATGSPFTYTVTTTGGACGSPSLTGTITVKPTDTLVLTSGATTNAQTVCLNSALTAIEYTFGGTVTGATVTGLPAGVTYAVSGSTVTITGAPTTLTGSPFTYTVNTTGGTCGSPSLTGTITVQPLATMVLTSNAATANQTVCENSSIVNIIYTFGGTATGATVTGLPVGVTASVSGTTVTISGTPTTATGSPFTYTVTTTGGACGSPSLTGTITVKPTDTLVLTSGATTNAQTVCLNSAITAIEYTFGGTVTGATVSGLPAGVTYAVSGSTVTITGAPTTLTGSPFTYTVNTTGGTCGSPSLTGTITVQPLATMVLTSNAATANQTVCVNSPITNIVYAFGGTATGATVTGLPVGVTASVTGTTVTISGTPTTATGSPFTYTVTTTGGACGSPSLTGTITVKPTDTLVLTSGATTNAQTVCLNSAITAIEYTFGGTVTGATVSGLPAGVTASVTGNTVTIIGAPTTLTGSPFTYTVNTTGGTCGSPSLTGTITVQPLATLLLTSNAATANQTVCVNSAITNIVYTFGGTATGATVTGLPVGVTASVTGNAVTISGTPTTTVGSPFSYTVTTTGGACGSPSLTGTITVRPLATITLSSPVGSDNQSVCAFSSIAVIRYTNGGTATGTSVTGLPTGVTASFSGGVTTISGVPTVPGIYNYTITTTGGACGTATLSGSITVIQAPIATQPTPYVQCDDNNDGVACTFILDTKIPEVTSSSTVSVTFHLTLTDSQTGFNPIPSNVPFCNNDYDQQTIYIRVFDPAAPACPTLTTLSLVVVPKPVATPPADYHKCDDNTDGIAVFNLNTVVNPQVLGSLAASQHTVTYYASQADALVPQNALTGTNAYTSASTTLWIRVQNNTTGCFDVVSVNLVVDPLPLLPAAGYFPQYELCETTAPVGYEIFNLNSQLPTILNGQTGIQVKFYPTLANANANTNAIANPAAYQNGAPYNQTIGIRLTNTTTGCYVVSTMDLIVNPKPAPHVPTAPYVVCDDNQDGVGQFDLNTLTPVLLMGTPALYTISYHLTQVDAQTPVNAIPLTQPFINNDPFVQIIWVRAEDPTTGCYTVVPVTLQVNVSPIAPTNLPTINNCDVDSNPQDGCTTFNLAAQTPAVLAQQTTAANNYTVTYYTSQADASASPAGINPIVNTTNYTACGTTTIWVRVEHKSSHCFAVGSFDLQVNTSLVLTTPTLYALCDDDATPNNQFTSFDLVSFVGTVPGHALAFYLNAAHTQPINNPSAFVNTVAANQTIFVVATDNTTGCKSYRTLTVRVLPVPTPRTNPPALAAKCDDTNPGDGYEIFDLTVNAGYILNGQANVSLHYYPSYNDAVANTNEILTPTAANVNQNVWIRVESNLNIDSFNEHCYILVEQALTVNPLPTLVQPVADYQECDDDTDNITAFNLTAWGQANLLTGNPLPLSNYSLSFYEDAAHTVLIPNPSNYLNTSSPQQLWVIATNTTTGCRSVVGTFNILVNPKPLATAPGPFDTCDTDGTNDGQFNLDLSQYVTTILTGQSATDFTVTFYNTQLDAENETNAIADLVNYMAYTHAIWIRVEDNLTGCARLVSFNATVAPLPEPVIETANNSHVICVDFLTDQVVRPLLLTASNLIPGTFTYEWYEASNPTTVIGTGSTYLVDTAATGGATRTYTVVMTSTNPTLPCNQASASFDVIQSGQAVVPAGTVGYVVTNAFSDLQTITVNVDGHGTYAYSLDDGPRQTLNVFENVSLGEHTITVWDTEGGMDNSCDPLVISGVSIIDYPHYFTPNGDGIHDTWNIVGLQNQVDAKIYIFDRMGKLIKQISPASPGWDGTYNGYLMPGTDYWFKVEYTEGTERKEFKAHFSLKR